MTGCRTNRIPVIQGLQGIAGLSALVGILLMGSQAVGAAESMRTEAQAMFGGAEYTVWGKISQIEDESFWIKKPDGEVVNVKVTEATNMVCSEEKIESRHASHGTGFESSDRAGQSAGFRIGSCPPGVGSFVELETTDDGMVTFLKAIDEDELKSRTENLGLPQEYVPQNP